jgi:hypothetical protein
LADSDNEIVRAIWLVVALEARPSVWRRQESVESQDPVDLMPLKELRFVPWLAAKISPAEPHACLTRRESHTGKLDLADMHLAGVHLLPRRCAAYIF